MRLACVATLILVGAIGASSTPAPASEVVTRPPVVAVTTWHPVVAKTLRSPAKGPIIKGHQVGLFLEAGYCLGGPKPEYDHVTVVELPRTKARPFSAAVVTAYVRWPEYSFNPAPGPPEYGGKCRPVRRTIFRRVHTKRPASGLRLYDGYFSPPHQVWPPVTMRKRHAGLTARQTPTVTWAPARAVYEGQPIPFTWEGSQLGRKTSLVIQRQVGTARTWQTVMRLPTRKGIGELPGLALGRYKLRIAALGSHHRVLARHALGIGVFGQVPFSTLFDRGEGSVYTTRTVTFPYVAHYESFERPAFTVEDNHCMSVHIAFVSGGGASLSGKPTSTLTLVQETRDPVVVQAAVETVASLDAQLVPGQSWSVNPDTTGGESTFYFNGYAVCSSRESFFS